MGDGKKVAIYLRVSTESQTTDNQLPALEAYATSRGYEVISIFKEVESAWRDGHQRELARLLADCRTMRNKPDIVLCWALDRLSRLGAAAILNLVNTFKSYGVRVISLQESWTELPGELGEVLFAITGWVARMESQRRSERTKLGLQRLKAMGKKLGRPVGSTDKKKRQKRVAKIHTQYFTPVGVY